MQSTVRVSESRFWRVFATAFVLAWALPLTASAASPEIFTGSIKGVAINGYDPVAYFTEKKPVAGKADITWSWKGPTWRFATAQNRECRADKFALANSRRSSQDRSAFSRARQ